MTLLSDIGGTVGNFLGASTGGVDDAAQNVQNIINSQAVQNAVNLGLYTPGTAGSAAVQAVNNLTKQHVTLNNAPANATQNQLDAVTQHYLQLYQNGGLQGKAAVEAAQQAAEFHAQGGLAGIHQNIMNSAANNAQVGQTAQSEISGAGGDVTALNMQKASNSLRQAALAAQVSQANYDKNLGAQQVLFGLNNTQQNLTSTATSDLNNAQNNAAMLALQQQAAQQQIGAQILSGLTSAATTGIGTIPGMSSQPVAATIPVTDNLAVPGTATGSQGYIGPTPAVSKMATPSPAAASLQPGTQSTAFTAAPILPVSASSWNGGN